MIFNYRTCEFFCLTTPFPTMVKILLFSLIIMIKVSNPTISVMGVKIWELMEFDTLLFLQQFCLLLNLPIRFFMLLLNPPNLVCLFYLLLFIRKLNRLNRIIILLLSLCFFFLTLYFLFCYHGIMLFLFLCFFFLKLYFLFF